MSLSAFYVSPKNLQKLITLGSDQNINFSKYTENRDFVDKIYETFFHKDSKYVTKRTLNTYIKMNTLMAGTDNGDGSLLHRRLLEISRIILTPFLGFDSALNEYSTFKNPNRSQMSGVISRCRSLLTEVFKTPNINVIFDYTRNAYNSNKNIKFYIDKLVDDKNEISLDPLDYTKRNGFIELVNPKNVMITVVIPVDFLEDLAAKNRIAAVNTINGASTYRPTNYDISLGNKEYVKMDGFAEDFATIFKENFIITLYKERYRENLYSQLYILINILEKEQYFENNNIKLKPKEMEEKLLKKYRKEFEKLGFKRNNEKENMTLKPDLSDYLEFFYGNEYYLANPIDVYNNLFELNGYECSLLASKLGFRPILSGTEYVRFHSSLYEINKDMNDNYSNMVVTSIMIKRLTPIILLSEYLIGNGMKDSVTKEILEKIKHNLRRLESKVNDYVYSVNLKKIVENGLRDISKLKIVSNILLKEKLLKSVVRNLYTCYCVDDNDRGF